MSDMNAGERIRGRRKEIGISVQALAKATGVAVPTLYELERGGMRGSTKMHLICAALGLNPAWVESGAGPRLADTNTKPQNTPFAVHSVILTPEAAHFAAEWEKLDEPAKSQILVMVESLVAAQVRANRKRRAEAPKLLPSPAPKA
jgi:transcriptional regulator with XRE-family HTH domain